MLFSRKNQKGVSLIEMLLVVAIIVIMAAVTIPIENRVLTSQSLSDGSNNLQMALRSANLQAKLGSHNLAAGVWIGEPVDGVPQVIFYRGPSFEERNTELDTPVDIPGGLTITATPRNDINFHILTAASEHDTIIEIKNGSGKRLLKVNVLGTVLEEKDVPATAK